MLERAVGTAKWQKQSPKGPAEAWVRQHRLSCRAVGSGTTSLGFRAGFEGSGADGAGGVCRAGGIQDQARSTHFPWCPSSGQACSATFLIPEGQTELRELCGCRAQDGGIPALARPWLHLQPRQSYFPSSFFFPEALLFQGQAVPTAGWAGAAELPLNEGLLLRLLLWVLSSQDLSLPTSHFYPSTNTRQTGAHAALQTGRCYCDHIAFY